MEKVTSLDDFLLINEKPPGAHPDGFKENAATLSLCRNQKNAGSLQAVHGGLGNRVHHST